MWFKQFIWLYFLYVIPLTTCWTPGRIVRIQLLGLYFMVAGSMFEIDGFITNIVVRMPLRGERAAPGSPWPMPKEWNQHPELLTLDPSTFELTSNIKCDITTKAFERYKLLMFSRGVKVAGKLTTVPELKVVIKNKHCDKWPSMTMDESYQLSVDTTATLKANEVWGFLKGLETFSQLIYYRDGEVFINKTTINDSPRFKYRGMHIDTSRHYIPVHYLKKNLNAMSYNKFNVFHWHIVDDQSFPFVSKTFPDLSKKGAYSSRHVYTPKDVADIIEYARLRGIRVIPEFDTPGHTHSWGNAYPDLLTPCWVNKTPGVLKWGQHAAYENLDPTNNFTYTFLEKFFAEVADVFPDDYIHMGMDETNYRCWESNPNITLFMAEHGMGKNYSQLELYYSDRTLGIISDLNKKFIIWQDPIENGANVRNDSIVMVWKGGRDNTWRKDIEQIATLGYNTILSSCWYLNYIKYPMDWGEMYSCDPHNFNGSQKEKDNVIGGETCIWAEYVDSTNMLPRIWPRASAAAERLWSPASVRDYDTALFRLDQHRCRMLRRGIPAEPLINGNCGDDDWGLLEDVVETETQTKEQPVCAGNIDKPSFHILIALTVLIFIAH